MLYTKFDFSQKETQELKMDLASCFKTENSNNIFNLIEDIHNKNPDFLFKNRGFFITRLFENNHGEIVNHLIENKIINFDLQICKYSSFFLSCTMSSTPSWEMNLFDFLVNNIHKHEKKYEMIQEFWEHFLEYQLLENKDLLKDSKNITYAFEKIPFYEESHNENINKNLIKSRESFFKSQLPKLPFTTQADIIHLFASLCAKYYPNFIKEFSDEFYFSDSAITLFKMHKTKNEVEEVIQNEPIKNKNKRIKI